MDSSLQRKKILWLPSWYPNREDVFTGDFIQRHAIAASIHNDIYVIHVRESIIIKNDFVEEIIEKGNLVEHIIYYKTSKGILSFFSKHQAWFQMYKHAIKKFIKQYGLPKLVHVHVAWKAGLIALWIKSRWNLPYFITEHWGMYNHVVLDNFFKKPFTVRYLIRKIFNESLQLVSVSQYLAEFIKPWMRYQKAIIIPNVVDVNLFYPINPKIEKFTFIHVSNGAALKNIRGILNAFKACSSHPEYDKMQLKIIGIDENTLLDHITELKLQGKVILKGEVSYDQVATEMQNSHCLILNSLMENSPCVIGEAHCCGIPVIATQVGGVPELVNEKNGNLIPANNDDALSKAIINMFENYLIFEQSEISALACEKYSYESVAKQFDAIYKFE